MVAVVKFTKATYRRARKIALAELLDAKDLCKRSEFGTVEDDQATDHYYSRLKKAAGIVNRGRREKGLWL